MQDCQCTNNIFRYYPKSEVLTDKANLFQNSLNTEYIQQMRIKK